jgi:Tol biopolymer transport system component
MLPREGEPSPFLATPFHEGSARFSPDGRFLAYESNESGKLEVYVVPYSGSSDRWTISSGGGAEPVWSPTGKELFYRNGDEMISVEINADGEFTVGESRRLFRKPNHASREYSSRAQYDVSPDGQSFLMIRLDPGSVPTKINIVLNWLEELKRLAPTDN